MGVTLAFTLGGNGKQLEGTMPNINEAIENIAVPPVTATEQSS